MMGICFRNYQKGDFDKIRSFLIKTFKGPVQGGNWRIDRWNFAFSMSRTMNFTTIQEMEKQIGIWENENNEIVAVVNSEGEGKGEVFFQVGVKTLPNEIVESIFDFAEINLLPKDSKDKTLQLWISDRRLELKNRAIERGYKKLDWSDITSSTKVSDWVYHKLPNGYSVRDGNQVTDLEKGKAHSLAFGYWQNELSKIAPICYEMLRQMPDYNPNLDLYIVDEKGQIVSFCTMWYDAVNKYGALEPVGTHFNYRRMGLGYAVISEAIKRVARLGAEKVYVGSDQEFYLSIGFKREFTNDIWEKTID